MSNATEKQYWFKRKKYGWGWGPPICWQGWITILIWIPTYAIGLVLSLEHGLIPPLVFTLIMILILTTIGYLKGEPPRWQWGEEK